MALLYADENFPLVVVLALRDMKHDVLTALEANQANQGVSDEKVLVFATNAGRAVLTFNRWHFIKLHGKNDHAGMIVCSEDQDENALANRIHAAIIENEPLAGKLIRVNRPS